MKTIPILTAFTVLLASPVFAQPAEERVRLSVSGAMTAGAIDGEASISASAGYRFAKNFSFEVELTATEAAANRFGLPYFTAGNLSRLTAGNFSSWSSAVPPRGAAVPPVPPNVTPLQNVVRGLPSPFIFPIPIEGFDDEGSTIMTTAGFRFELPVEGTRFRPYLSAGMGLARTEQEFNIGRFSTPTIQTQVSGPSGTVTSSISTTSFPRVEEEEFTHTGIMVTFGVGASVQVWKGLSIDLNARYFKLDRDRDLGSLGGGVSYRF